MNIIPINKWILLKTYKKNKKTNILTTSKENNYSNKGIVVSLDKKSNYFDLKKGSVVFFKKTDIRNFKINKKKYFFINYKNVIAYLK